MIDPFDMENPTVKASEENGFPRHRDLRDDYTLPPTYPPSPQYPCPSPYPSPYLSANTYDAAIGQMFTTAY